ncbi:MAG: hypothetical protein JXB88_11415 [Spirochaetales bacterium]|nr:hypothetical protein [Spirochaetales bacterium]
MKRINQKNIKTVLPSWTHIRINLKCLNARSGSREPVTAVFQSIFKNSWMQGKFGKEKKMVFHPCAEQEIKKIITGHIYSFFVVFNDPYPATGRKFTVCLYQYLEKTAEDLSLPYHFTLYSFSICEPRNCEIIKLETGLYKDCNSLVLSFITPLNLKNSQRKAKNWEITGEKLITLFKKRIKSFFNIELPGNNDEFTHFKCSPYYWNYTSYNHKSKSNNHTMYLNGYTGYLPIDGIPESLMDMIAACADISNVHKNIFLFPFVHHRDTQLIH